MAHYFKVVPEGGQAIISGERRLPLQNTVNTRDLGGYETAEGRKLKWGKVFRSDHLARLSESDILYDQYGSPFKYLTSRAGVAEEMLQAVKNHLLE